MPVFKYEAMDTNGKPKKGEISAVSADDAIASIKNINLYPSSVREKGQELRERKPNWRKKLWSKLRSEPVTPKPNTTPPGQTNAPRITPSDLIKVAISTQKTLLMIAKMLKTEQIGAICTYKMIDCIEAILDSKFDLALNDIWQSNCGILKVYYDSMSEKLDKKSDRSVAGNVMASDHNYIEASRQYIEAICEITEKTEYEQVFEILRKRK